MSATARRTRRDPFVYGLIFLAVLGIGTYFAFTKAVPFVHGFQLRALFASANQLRGGSPVRIAGVDVGRVSGIARGPGSTALVTMDISSQGQPIHADATLRIRPRLFLEGGFYVELSPGSPSSPTLFSGATVPLPQTSLPVQFDQLLSGAFTRPTRESFRAVVGTLSVALGRGGAAGVRETFRQLPGALRYSAVASAAARGTQRHDVSGFVSGAAEISAALASRSGQLADLVTAVNRVSGALAREDVALAGSVVQLDALLAQAPGDLSAIDGALGPLRRFVVASEPGLRALPPALDSTAALLGQLRGLASPPELRRLLASLAPVLSTGAHGLPALERGLTRLFALVTPVTDCVREKVVPVLNATVPDGALSTGRPAWQDLVHGAVGTASVVQDFDANGPWIRYQIGAGDQLVSTPPLPGVGPLIGRATLPLLGARPQWLGPGTALPFRPGTPCTSQPLVDLNASSGTGVVESSRNAPAARLPLTAASLAPLVTNRPPRGLRLRLRLGLGRGR